MKLDADERSKETGSSYSKDSLICVPVMMFAFFNKEKGTVKTSRSFVASSSEHACGRAAPRRPSC